MSDSSTLILQLVETALGTDRTPEQVCVGTPALLPDVQRLWEQCRRNEAELDAFFRPPRLGTNAVSVGERPGTVLGSYTLDEPLGEGGFAVVFAAMQTRPVRRRVAVKVIKAGMDTREVVARFEAERQTLALMDHPNIARVYDAGATEGGRPYFVMELVEGVPLTAYCDTHRLSVRRRVELMSTVCRAVHSAHQKGVIHRDLKPANVLVTVVNDQAVPKVIDFGVAKATALTDPNDRTLFTRLGYFVGTPAYASPEQAEPTGRGVDTRTDVYGLGATLYDSLTGVPPLPPDVLKQAGPGEVARLIREAEPVRPSIRLAHAPAAVALARDADPRRTARQVRGELDWIVGKALEKDRDRRYDTAAALADDLDRYLAGDAVHAGPPGRAYRCARFVRKHRVTLGVAVTVAAALLLGIAGLSVGLVRAADARRLAEAGQTEAETQRHLAERRRVEAEEGRKSAEAVMAFLTRDVLGQALPARTPEKATRDALVQTLIEPVLSSVPTCFEGQPLSRAAVQFTLADVLNDLGRPDLALPQAEAAWRTRVARLGEGKLLTLVALGEYAAALTRLDRWDEALPLRQRAWLGFRRAGGDDATATILAMREYLYLLAAVGRRDEAIAVLDEAVRAIGPDEPATATAWYLGGSALANVGDPDAAVGPLRKAAAAYRRLAPADPNRSWALFWLGHCLISGGHDAEARAVFAEKITVDTAQAGAGPSVPLRAAWGSLRESLGRFAAAPVADHLSGRAGQVLLAGLEFALTDWFRLRGRFDLAVPVLRRCVARLRRVSPDDPQRGRDLYWFGQSLLAVGRADEAEAVFRDNIAYDLRLTGTEMQIWPGSVGGLTASLSRQGRPVTAQRLRKQLRLDFTAPTAASASR